MREILFKAKRLDNGEWVQGNVFFGDDGKCEICVGNTLIRIANEVNPETSCQYTGLTDKNGVKIFEGDVIKYEENTTHTVKFVDGMFICDGFYDSSFDTPWDAFSEGTPSIEVIGNIHDNA